jgi:guanine deaminase
MADRLDLRGRTLLASGFHAPERGSIDVLRDALIAIGRDGVIQTVTRPGENGYEMSL